MDSYNAIGLLGVFLYVGSYSAMQLGLLKVTNSLYSLLNLLAAIASLISVEQHMNISMLTMQIIWALLSAIGLARSLKAKRLERKMMLNPLQHSLF